MHFAPNLRRPIRLAMDGRLESVARAGHAVRDFGLAAGLDDTAAGDLELATVEAANNIILHGFEGAAALCYRVTIALRHGEVQVMLTDGGPAIPAGALDAPRQWDADPDASRGLAIMRACADRFEYRRSRGRNRLLLGKRLPL